MFKLPSTDQVRQLGEGLGFDLTDDYANSFINYIRPFADGFRLLAALPDDVPAIKHPRGAYYRPEGDENKYGAWIAKTHIKGAPSGRLAGKKVAIKDTYAIAGVPLTNGSSVLEGFVPEFDATSRYAAPRCRRGDRRQVGLRIFFLLRRRGHQYDRTRSQSARVGPHARRLFDRLRRSGRGG